jgi:hypothetical protein
MIPTTGSDRGIFISVAERLRAGDQLYSEVWDNKDPFFYYVLAIGRQVSPTLDIAVEIGWVLAGCIGLFGIAKYLNLSPRFALLAGFMFTPLILTGAFYYPGYTHIPGIALTILSLSLAVRKRWVLSGACIGFLILFKLVLLPVSVIAIAILILHRRQWRSLVRLSIGVAAPAIGGFSLIALRGEFPAYFNALLKNAAYSNGSLLEAGTFPILAHFQRTISIGMAASVLVMAIALTLLNLSSTPVKHPSRAQEIWLMSWGALAGGVLVIGLTGLWDHHNQAIYPAALLVTVLVVQWAGVRAINLAVTVLIGLSASLLFAGLPSPKVYLDSLLYARGNLFSLTSSPPETTALLELGTGGNYARVGMNDDLGHAFGLNSWPLACPRFHQYPHETGDVLNSDLTCLEKATNLIVSSSFREIPGNAIWNSYVQSVETLLASRFRCAVQQSVRICTATA